MRKSPGGMFIIETRTLAPLPRSTTRILPETADPPIARSVATWPYDPAATFGSDGVASPLTRSVEHPETIAAHSATLAIVRDGKTPRLAPLHRCPGID